MKASLGINKTGAFKVLSTSSFFFEFHLNFKYYPKLRSIKTGCQMVESFFFFHLKFEHFNWNSFFFNKDIQRCKIYWTFFKFKRNSLLLANSKLSRHNLTNFEQLFFFVPNFFNLSKHSIWKIDCWEFTFKEFFVLKSFALALLPNKQRHIALCFGEMGIFSTV